MNISQASIHIAELIEQLDYAYWQANHCDNKDHHYNLIRILTDEYIEIMKISAQDHHYPYEVISVNPKQMVAYLESYQQNLLNTVIEHKTRIALSEQLGTLLHHFDQ